MADELLYDIGALGPDVDRSSIEQSNEVKEIPYWEGFTQKILRKVLKSECVLSASKDVSGEFGITLTDFFLAGFTGLINKATWTRRMIGIPVKASATSGSTPFAWDAKKPPVKTTSMQIIRGEVTGSFSLEGIKPWLDSAAAEHFHDDFLPDNLTAGDMQKFATVERTLDSTRPAASPALSLTIPVGAKISPAKTEHTMEAGPSASYEFSYDIDQTDSNLTHLISFDTENFGSICSGETVLKAKFGQALDISASSADVYLYEETVSLDGTGAGMGKKDIKLTVFNNANHYS